MVVTFRTEQTSEETGITQGQLLTAEMVQVTCPLMPPALHLEAESCHQRPTQALYFLKLVTPQARASVRL